MDPAMNVPFIDLRTQHRNLQDELNQAMGQVMERDVLVAPSVVTPNLESDGIPAVFQEATATRVPVVATSVGGIPELD